MVSTFIFIKSSYLANFDRSSSAIKMVIVKYTFCNVPFNGLIVCGRYFYNATNNAFQIIDG